MKNRHEGGWEKEMKEEGTGGQGHRMRTTDARREGEQREAAKQAAKQAVKQASKQAHVTEQHLREN